MPRELAGVKICFGPTAGVFSFTVSWGDMPHQTIVTTSREVGVQGERSGNEVPSALAGTRPSARRTQ
jgi:hypothetical protein